jgi:hypothetical protein
MNCSAGAILMMEVGDGGSAATGHGDGHKQAEAS